MACESCTLTPSLIDTMNRIRGKQTVMGCIQRDGGFLLIAVGHQPEGYSAETFPGTLYTISQ